MISINELISKKKVRNTGPAKKRNLDWEEACDFGDYVGLHPAFVMRLFKQYGKEKVLDLRSYLKDAPYKKKLEGLTVWKLKQVTEKEEEEND